MRWQSRLDTVVVVAALVAVVAVGLQTLSGPAHDVGVALSWLVWIVFAADVVIGLSLTDDRGAWARRHILEIGVLVLAWPVWALVAHDLLAGEILPALTLLDATKLAKLAKSLRIVYRRAPRPVAGGLAAIIIAAAAAIVVRVFAKG